MLASIRTSVLALVRDKSLLVWTLAFPLIMTSIFMAMFSGLNDAYSLVESRLGVVRNARYESVKGLDDMLASLAGAPKKSRICTLKYYASEKDARNAATDGAIDSYLTVGSDGTPALHVSQASIAAKGPSSPQQSTRTSERPTQSHPAQRKTPNSQRRERCRPPIWAIPCKSSTSPPRRTHLTATPPSTSPSSP